jgi:hypothetical protein
MCNLQMAYECDDITHIADLGQLLVWLLHQHSEYRIRARNIADAEVDED